MSEKYFNKAVETMPRSELEVFEGEKLRELVSFVYERVPFYRAKMDAIKLKPGDIRNISDIVKLPFTEKSDLRDNYPFKMFALDKKDVVRIHASSGTTGKLTVVGYSRKDLDLWAEAVARGLTAAGVDENSTVHVAYGYGMFTGGLGLHYGAEKIGARVIPMSSGNTVRQLTLLRDFEATTLCCTPSYAAFLGEALHNNGYDIKDFKLRSGVFGAEPWSDNMRKSIEKALKIAAFDIYGLSEISGPGVATDCKYQNGLHVCEDMFYPEILDAGLNPVKNNAETGELVFTTLQKEAIPLIRYRTRDLCSLDSTPCACGRTHMRMGKILGRSDDMLIIRGVNVFPSQIETAILECGYVSPNYHLIVDRINNADTLTVEVELSPEFNFDEVKEVENLVDEINRKILIITGLNTVVKPVAPGTIARSEGKAKRVTDKRNF